jgi:hypothetical protein
VIYFLALLSYNLIDAWGNPAAGKTLIQVLDRRGSERKRESCVRNFA